MAMIDSEPVHMMSVVSLEAVVASDVRIGPYAVVEGLVEIGPGCVIEAHACLRGPLTMGRDNFVGHGAVLGGGPRRRDGREGPGVVRIGDRNVFREYATIYRGTPEGGGETIVGDDNLFMCNSHLGPDALVGNGCTVVNNALISERARLDDACILSGHTVVGPRVRIGRLAMLGGMATSSRDVPPFVLQQGRDCVTGMNLMGLRRAGASNRAIDALRQAFRILYCEGLPTSHALDRIAETLGGIDEVAEFVDFICESKTGVNPARFDGRRKRDGD